MTAEEWARNDDVWIDCPIPPAGRLAIAEVIAAWDESLVGCSIRTCDDGDGWAFWLHPDDTTSYLHADLLVEWYGSEGSDPEGATAEDPAP